MSDIKDNDEEKYYIFRPVNEEDARIIASWEYCSPFDFYNLHGNTEAVVEMLTLDFFAVTDKAGELSGFFCYGEPARVLGGKKLGLYTDQDYLDVGLGMRPDLTGKGLGQLFLTAGLRFAACCYNPKGFRLTVAAVNQRAISVYKRAGFQQTTVFISPVPDGDIKEFCLMKKERD